MEIQSLHVDSIQERYDIEYGCTCPLEITLEDGKKAIAKYCHNGQGEVVPFNEYVSYMISKTIGAPIPDGGIAVIDERTIISDKVELGIEHYEGLCFYSEYIAKAVPLSKRTAKHITNLEQVPCIILLDQIIRNLDRYSSNILVSADKTLARMYIIDHSHAFGSPEWDESTFKPDDYDNNIVWQENHDAYDMLIQAGADVGRGSLLQESRRIKSIMTRCVLDEIFQKIPEFWSIKVGEKRVEYLKQYIFNRVKNLDRICGMICRERGV